MPRVGCLVSEDRTASTSTSCGK